MKTTIAPEYDKSLPMQARLEARAERLGSSGGAALDAELLLDARSVITDLLAACTLAEHELNPAANWKPRDKGATLRAIQAALARAEGGAP